MQLRAQFQKYRYLIALLAVITILTATALGLIFSVVGHNWEGVPLQFTGDSYFYYARLKEIFDGHPFVGNPFYLEHNGELALSFFVADWLAAWPLFLGFSISSTVIFNLFFWSWLFTAIFYFVLRCCAVPEKLCLIGALLGYVTSFSILARAVSLQTVLPVFLIFLLAIIIWQKYPTSKKAVWLVAISATLSVYVYTYLTQIIAVFMPLMIVYLSVKHRRREATYLAAACALAFIASIPFLAYTWQQIQSPYFWESMRRVGLVYTHLPATNFFTSGFWVAAALGLWFFLWRWVEIIRQDETYKKTLPLYALSGVAMLITSGSNILSGKESENSQHIERFMVVWLAAVFTILVAYALKYRQQIKTNGLGKKITLSALLLIVSAGVLLYAREGFSLVTMVRENRQTVVERQFYAAPLNWLEEQRNESVVIWTLGTDDINNYIPILTKHYVLFAPSGSDYLFPDTEQVQRYLTSHYFDDLTQADIEADFWSYAGVANAVHQYKVYNRRVRVCRLLFLDKLGYNCGELVANAVTFRGENFFSNLYQQYTQEIKPNISEKLRQYHVSYVLVDNLYYPALQTNIIIIGIQADIGYQDSRFTIYKLTNG
ncbi:hypothetical protein A3I35_02040 [Candidatus Falkowbacteria bacterium RIFCSPLOWO2_02_FULL_45_15]|uniref:Glycosyltransferase RgtA/B/C/D-like domain-containing protein n=2 Tax=Candidatus Falkowiibacteriota TaxID=1752728 RepID=A0A1F5RJM9_9BACT|nr:MAG: hypothetical protein A3D54_01705 [Candidatus Falkowbacteria bacterium RIFCSPHIGHO2_02_FULL_45_15]OGF19605.1 MAG: hypothetical protein A3I35_02040 [Candidatus Falkowbacteria bacterium RIFCSPLOWO2_02_FULL_45_15]